ncbi:MAG: hypothetical protein AAFR87_33990 [Bacteroidota bacterium]
MSKLRDQLDRSNVSNITERDFIRKAKDRKYYGYTFDQAGRHPISLAIDFFLKNGNRFGIFYMEISSPIMLNLGNGSSKQTISLNTANLEIIISGKDLAPVYEYLLEQRLVWIKEIEASFIPVDHETLIESITYDAK